MSSLLIDDFGGDMFTVDCKLSGSFNAEELQGLSGTYWCEKIAAYLSLHQNLYKNCKNQRI